MKKDERATSPPQRKEGSEAHASGRQVRTPRTCTYAERDDGTDDGGAETQPPRCTRKDMMYFLRCTLLAL